MKSVRYILVLGGILGMALSCGKPLPRPAELPTILRATVESVSTDGALLSAEVSESTLVAACGFYVTQNGTTQSIRVEAGLSGNSFAAMAGGLRPDTGYEFEAFVENGRGLSVKSGRQPFVTLPPDSDLPSYSMTFETFILREFDTDKDGTLSEQEALAVRKMTVPTDSIASAPGLGRFRNLDTLIIRPHRMTLKSLLKELDLTGNPAMRYLNAVRNDMLSIQFPKQSELHHANIGFNNYTTLDLSTLLKTEYVNLTGCHRLQTVYLGKDQQIELTGLPSSATIVRYDQ